MTLSASDQDELREPHKDPNLRSNPFELHWRSAGPKWKGNMDGAFRGKYPHMDDEIYCRLVFTQVAINPRILKTFRNRNFVIN